MIFDRDFAEITDQNFEGRTLLGRALTFNRDYKVNDGAGTYVENYAPQSFERTLARTARHPLYTLHDTKKLPVGTVDFSADGSSLMFKAEIARTVAGDEALELARMGALRAFSIGARAVSPVVPTKGRIVRTEVALREGSLVPAGALPDAGVLTIRQEIDVDEIELMRFKLLALRAA